MNVTANPRRARRVESPGPLEDRPCKSFTPWTPTPAGRGTAARHACRGRHPRAIPARARSSNTCAGRACGALVAGAVTQASRVQRCGPLGARTIDREEVVFGPGTVRTSIAKRWFLVLARYVHCACGRTRSAVTCHDQTAPLCEINTSQPASESPFAPPVPWGQ